MLRLRLVGHLEAEAEGCIVTADDRARVRQAVDAHQRARMNAIPGPRCKLCHAFFDDPDASCNSCRNRAHKRDVRAA